MKIIFDIGGTNTRISFIKDGKIGEILKVFTPQDLESFKDLIIESVKKISGKENIESIVGGVAGVLMDGKIVNSPNLKNWNGFEIQSFLQSHFCEKSFVYNDADLAGLGESVYGAGRGISIVAYIGIGTGIGGVRIVNEEITKNNFGFEPGHHILDVINNKTFEELVSGRAIEKKYGEKPEKVGSEIFARLVPTLVAGLYNAILFWSPEVLILGGSLLNENTSFKMGDIKDAFGKLDMKIRTLPKILKAELGDSSGLWGALVMTDRI